ncbi:MAG: hypothetical protein LC643_05435 [Bacteroidales bacterium]|nr:hypothetical protein [Bacteroidales bacterium]
MSQPVFSYTPLAGYEHFEATTQIIIAEILKRNLPFEVIDADNNLLAVTWNQREYIIHEGTISDGNSLIAYWISNDKWMTKQFLARKGVLFAKGVILQKEDAFDAAMMPEFPLVVKPANTDHGIGVSTAIINQNQLLTAIERAFSFSDKVIVEEYYPGKEFRFLVIDGHVRAIAYREPANVIGDGVSTVQQLIAEKNIGRGDDYRYPLLKIRVDEEVLRHLQALSLTIESVIPKGEKVFLRKNSNLSTGGDSIDVTDAMPDFYKEVAVKAAGAAGLRIAGVDISSKIWKPRLPQLIILW